MTISFICLLEDNMEFQLGRLNKAREQLGEPPIELDKLEFEKPFIENDRLVDKDTHKVIGTKGDMYTKQILYKVLTEGCMDHDPRPRYFDEYKNASYKRYILTEDGNRFVLDDDDIVKEEEGKIIVSSSGNSELTEDPLYVIFPFPLGFPLWNIPSKIAPLLHLNFFHYLNLFPFLQIYNLNIQHLYY